MEFCLVRPVLFTEEKIAVVMQQRKDTAIHSFEVHLLGERREKEVATGVFGLTAFP